MGRYRDDRESQSIRTAHYRLPRDCRIRSEAADLTRGFRTPLGSALRRRSEPLGWEGRAPMRLRMPPVILALTASLFGADPPTSLSALLDEASRNNPEILGARRGWQAASQVPTQVSTLPDPQVTFQSFSVGSPRPFAGFSNNDFAYIGFGVSQDIPYPGKLKLKGEAARQDAAISRDKLESVRRSVLQQ